MPHSSDSPASISFVVLCQGAQANGVPYWAYLQLLPNKAKAFRTAQASGAFRLQDYGEILTWGEGETVPDDVRARMEREHGVSHDFERDALQAIANKQNPNGG